MTQVRKERAAGPRRVRTLSPAQASRRRGPIDAALDPELFRALGDPTRARLLGCMVKCARACSVSEVAECCAVDLSVVSRHLALLARAGVLEPSRSGRVVMYRVRAAELASRLRELASAIELGACRGGGCEGGCCDG
jgi:ArsR family transcriptional regulator